MFHSFNLLLENYSDDSGLIPAVFRYTGGKGAHMAVIETTAQVIDIEAPGGKVDRRKGRGRGFGTGAGSKRAFESGQQLIDELEKYCDYLKSINYQEYPTKMGFADFCGKNRSTVWNAVNNFYPEIKKQWQETIEQVLVNGVNAGVYHVTMTIFILKNWCEWTDKRETVTTEKKPAIASKQELRDAIQQYLQAPIEEDGEQTE